MVIAEVDESAGMKNLRPILLADHEFVGYDQPIWMCEKAVLLPIRVDCVKTRGFNLEDTHCLTLM